MSADYLDLYERSSAWALAKIKAATDQLDAPTPCDGWDLRTLLNHMLETQRYFLASGRGEDASPPAPEPPEIISADPPADFGRARAEMLEAFGEPGVVEKTGPTLGIVFADQLLHGWDVARATKQDTAMPDDLAKAAYDTIHGQFTEDQRKGVFKPEIDLGSGVSPQQMLLAYTGRKPD